MKRLLKFFGWYIALSGAAALLLLVSVYPYYPKSMNGWMLLLVLALPITLAGEFIGESIFTNRVARTIDDKTKAQPISVLRILYTLIAMLLALEIAWWGVTRFLGRL